MHSIIFSSIFMVTMVISPFASAQDRMPPLEPDQTTAVQQKAAAELAAGPRGRVMGPFVSLLRSPEFMSRLQKTGEYLRFRSALGARFNELVILITARQWTQQFEWFAHYPIALKAGVTADIAQAIAEGRRPLGMAEDEEVVYDFCEELYSYPSSKRHPIRTRCDEVWRTGRHRHAWPCRLLLDAGYDHECRPHATAGWGEPAVKGVAPVN
jgi:alkylhydroperoxidase family enzyme